MTKKFIPDRGDIVWIDMNPQAGHEQGGRRPAIVLSPDSYNRKVGLALFCPVTSHVKGYPFEVIIPEGLNIKGAILSDQVKCLDWKERRSEFICKIPDVITLEVIKKLGTLIYTKT